MTTILIITRYAKQITHNNSALAHELSDKKSPPLCRQWCTHTPIRACECKLSKRFNQKPLGGHNTTDDRAQSHSTGGAQFTANHKQVQVEQCKILNG
jgi:hypothetical protein